MKRIIFTLLLIFPPSIYAFDYKSYNPIEFSEMLQKHEGEFGEETDIGISAAIFKYRSKIKYTDGFRSIPKDRKKYLEHWRTSLRQSKDYTDLYKYELKVLNGDKEYWFPIQDQLIAHLKKELKQNQDLELYYLYVGANRGDVILFLSEFKAK